MASSDGETSPSQEKVPSKHRIFTTKRIVTALKYILQHNYCCTIDQWINFIFFADLAGAIWLHHADTWENGQNSTCYCELHFHKIYFNTKYILLNKGYAAQNTSVLLSPSVVLWLFVYYWYGTLLLYTCICEFLFQAFDYWLRIPEEKLKIISEITQMLHNASLL